MLDSKLVFDYDKKIIICFFLYEIDFFSRFIKYSHNTNIIGDNSKKVNEKNAWLFLFLHLVKKAEFPWRSVLGGDIIERRSQLRIYKIICAVCSKFSLADRLQRADTKK